MFILSDPNLGDFDLDDAANGIILTRKDFGFPTVREVISNYPDDHGIVDRTAYFGERVVSCDGYIVDRSNSPRYSTLNRLKQYLLPYARPVLRFNYDGGSPILQTDIRIDNHSSPIENSRNYQFNLSFKVQPFFKGANYSASAGFNTSLLSATDIWDPPFFPIHFEHAVGDSITVINAGMVETWPLITLFGPIVDPVISNISTGKQIRLTSIDLGEAPSKIVYDMKNRTVILDGLNSLAVNIDYSVSEWWSLEPGVNIITLDGTSPTDTSRIILQWNDLYL